MGKLAILKTNKKHLGEAVSEELDRAGIPITVKEVSVQESVLYSPNENEYRGEQSIIRYALSMSGSK